MINSCRRRWVGCTGSRIRVVSGSGYLSGLCIVLARECNDWAGSPSVYRHGIACPACTKLPLVSGQSEVLGGYTTHRRNLSSFLLHVMKASHDLYCPHAHPFIGLTVGVHGVLARSALLLDSVITYIPM